MAVHRLQRWVALETHFCYGLQAEVLSGIPRSDDTAHHFLRPTITGKRTRFGCEVTKFGPLTCMPHKLSWRSWVELRKVVSGITE